MLLAMRYGRVQITLACALSTAFASLTVGEAAADDHQGEGLNGADGSSGHSSSSKQSRTSKDQAIDEGDDTDYGHFFQFGARAGLSLPYKVMARFDDSPPCDVEDAVDAGGKVCGFGSAPALDVGLSFAPFDAIEPYLWLRLGLGEEERTNTAAVSLFGAGVRIYTMSDSMFKLFFEPALAIEAEGAADESLFAEANYDTDFLVHLNFGGQIDFSRYAGIYFAAGPNVSFVRAITTTLELNAGLQLRVP